MKERALVGVGVGRDDDIVGDRHQARVLARVDDPGRPNDAVFGAQHFDFGVRQVFAHDVRHSTRQVEREAAAAFDDQVADLAV